MLPHLHHNEETIYWVYWVDAATVGDTVIKKETPILQSFGSIKQFYTYFIPHDMKEVFKNA